ncbi:transglutaminase-like domain-containing protein [Geothermobacter hydrogeniphilus]|uniref:Transglutaminase n=1 Tax=Geothermobacter hydrogeniphilus TaxID=1969733 RepID=A0A1X0Y2A9_9BACT|nr:transglutaminase family protein [Geothermobacter hydrogeniphilus]ORJ59234.1 transglutaminase [Geothermobacter hydrogeniphilus]
MERSTFLQPGEFVDSDSHAVRDFAHIIAGDAASPIDQAVNLYYAVRDGIRYTPYLDFTDVENYRASSVLGRGFGFCISKASLLAACCRVMGLPARLGFADVRNHLTTPRLRELNGGDLMRWHAFTEILLDGRWVKATPAFNLELCTRFRVKPLEFDGREDSIFHPYDVDQRRHLEYVHDRGVYADVPFEEILTTFRRHSPKLLGGPVDGDFAAEAEQN